MVRKTYFSRIGSAALVLIRLGLLVLLILGSGISCQKPKSQKLHVDVANIDRARVVKAADKYLKLEPVTITSFVCERSAGGIHDFYSEGDYWWPNPENPDGPYIRRDGMTNPENFIAHRKAMRNMSIQVAALTAAWKITGNEVYARHAIRHLRAWFINEATTMNPNLMYAQAIKGRVTGRGIGIIDTIHLVEVARAISVLEKGSMISAEDQVGLKNWFSEYLHWMTTHDYGIAERDNGNNHSTCWAMQVAEFADLVGNNEQKEYCRKMFRNVLLPDQMAPDGSFPKELKRTKPYNYSLFNLDAMAMVCQILSTSQDNLWAYTTPDGKSMCKAVEFMYPYIKDKSTWPYKPDVMYYDLWPVRQPSLLFAGIAFNESKYVELWKSLNPDPDNEEVLRNFPIRQPVLWVD